MFLYFLLLLLCTKEIYAHDESQWILAINLQDKTILSEGILAQEIKDDYLLWYEGNIYNKVDGDMFSKLQDDKTLSYSSYHKVAFAQKLSQRFMIFFAITLKDYNQYKTELYSSNNQNETSFSLGLSFPMNL